MKVQINPHMQKKFIKPLQQLLSCIIVLVIQLPPRFPPQHLLPFGTLYKYSAVKSVLLPSLTRKRQFAYFNYDLRKTSTGLPNGSIPFVERRYSSSGWMMAHIFAINFFNCRFIWRWCVLSFFCFGGNNDEMERGGINNACAVCNKRRGMQQLYGLRGGGAATERGTQKKVWFIATGFIQF